MQEKEQKKSPIKQRILQFARENCGSKREFYAQTGISRGTLESDTGITEDTLVKFFAAYKQVNPLYIIIGEGSLFKEKEGVGDLPGLIKADEEPQPITVSNDTNILRDLVREKDHRIEELCEKVGRLQGEVAQLKKDDKKSCHSNYTRH